MKKVCQTCVFLFPVRLPLGNFTTFADLSNELGDFSIFIKYRNDGQSKNK